MRRAGWLAAAACAAALCAPHGGGAATSAPVRSAHAAEENWAPRPDPGVKDWYQRRGNAARSGLSTFEPLRTPPVEAWRVKLPAQPLSNVVSWDGTVFVAVRSRSGLEVRAFAVRDGAAQGVARLTDKALDGDVDLAVCGGHVVVRYGSTLAFVIHKAGAFRMPVLVKDSDLHGAPLVHDGTVYVASGAGSSGWRLKEFAPGQRDGSLTDIRSGDRPARASDPVSFREPWLDVPATLDEDGEYYGTVLRIGAQFPRQSIPLTENGVHAEGLPGVSAHRLSDGTKGGWLVVSRHAMRSTKGDATGCYFPDWETGFYPFGIVSEPVVLRGRAIAWDADGELVDAAPGSVRTLLKPDNLPAGFVKGPLSAARDVLYVGNAAVETASGRVLWCIPGLQPASPLIPCGNARIAVLTRDDELVGYGGADAQESGATPEPVSYERPLEGDGVLLRDGSSVAGAVQLLDGGRVRVTASGGAREFGADEVAVATKDGRRVGAGDEFHAYRAWRRAVRAECAAEFAEQARRLTTERVLDGAREMLRRARDMGLDQAEFERLSSRMTGLTPTASADARWERVEREFAAQRKKLAQGFLDGAAWLAQRGFATGAAALLADVPDVDPNSTTWHAKARELAPAEFPFRERDDAGPQWSRWARALLPAGARFLSPSAPEWGRVRFAPWSSGCVGLESRNLRLFSRSEDPEVVGACLQRGEAAVRALEELLGGGDAATTPPPLVVLLHKNQKEYLAERAPGGSAPPWSAGYFSPVDGISRFFVPGEGGVGDPLGRSLYSTLAHELTHHWIDRRWAADSSGASTPGYWVVEGIASFVGDQVADSEPHEVHLDDPRVTSIDAMAQAAAAGKALPLSSFVDLSHEGFARLGDKPLVTVQLRNTLGGRILSERALFYEQAAALTFFLANRRGDDGRERLKRYLWAHYAGNAPRGGWKPLGFADQAAFAKDFAAFLAELAGRPVRLEAGPIVAGAADLPAAGEPAGAGAGAKGSSAPRPGDDAPFEIGDEVWVLIEGKYRAGNITGEIDGEFWVSFGMDGVAQKVRVPKSLLRHR